MKHENTAECTGRSVQRVSLAIMADGSDKRLTKDKGRVIRSGKEYDAEKEEAWRELALVL